MEPSSVVTEPKHLKLVTVSSFCPFTLISVLMPLALWSSNISDVELIVLLSSMKGWLASELGNKG